jgi:hypothetical protein
VEIFSTASIPVPGEFFDQTPTSSLPEKKETTMDNPHEPTNVPPRMTPPPPPPAPHSSAVPLGALPEDGIPIASLAEAIESVLRSPRRLLRQLVEGPGSPLNLWLLIITFVSMALYGIVLGTFSGGSQFWIAPLKVTVGLLFAGVICLPSLYVFACLSGSRAGVREIAGVFLGISSLACLLLAGLAPAAWIFSESSSSVAVIGAIHIVFWLAAIAFGLRFLNRTFCELRSESAFGLRIWSVIFVLVTLQLTTALRPILGPGDLSLPREKKFFLQHWSDTLQSPVRTAPKSENF